MGETGTRLHGEENEATEKETENGPDRVVVSEKHSRWVMRFFFYLFVHSVFIACLPYADSTELGTTSYFFCFLIKLMKTHISEFRVLQDKGHICNPKQRYTAIQKTSLRSSKWQHLKCSQVAILLMYFGSWLLRPTLGILFLWVRFVSGF